MRLLIGSQLEVVQTQVCRDQEEVRRTGEEWKAAMIEGVALSESLVADCRSLAEAQPTIAERHLDDLQVPASPVEDQFGWERRPDIASC